MGLNSSALVLERTEGDGGGDGSLWLAPFKELKKAVVALNWMTQHGLLVQGEACCD